MPPSGSQYFPPVKLKGVKVAAPEIKNFDSPDETRPFEGKGQAYVLNIGGGPTSPHRCVRR